jgi:hypothetical protein
MHTVSHVVRTPSARVRRFGYKLQPPRFWLNGEIRVQCRDHFDRCATIGHLAQDAHTMGGAEGSDTFPHNGMVVRQYHRRC